MRKMEYSILNNIIRRPAVLVLEDGTMFRGQAFGAKGEAGGEVVFNTSMTGYQEVLTDPSYYGQIVAMTYPLIGNYGINEEDLESKTIQVAGFIVKELSYFSSNWRSNRSLEDWMITQNKVGLCGIDTRELVRKLRIHGVMRGIIADEEGTTADLIAKAQAIPSMAGSDLVQAVTTKEPYEWHDRLHVYHRPRNRKETPEKQYRVVAFDYGIKQNILRHLTERGCEVQVMPASVTPDDIDQWKPDGIFLSNGPGDPEPVSYAVDTIRKLLGKYPVFGICLGHQLLGLALGGKTYKLKFGHRGANQPVKHMESGKIDITSQNHGFCVDIDSLKDHKVEITHMNLNDQTVEGLEAKDLRCFSVQYHPEASPGPHDATHHFDRFIRLMSGEK